MLGFNFGPSEAARPARRQPVRCVRSYRGTKYWQEQGWRLNGHLMEGYYRTLYRSFKGRIELFDSGDHLYFIHDPPSQLRQHSHWACFVQRGNGWYWVHFSIKAKNVDTGIITIEKILCQALERYHG